MSRVAVKIRQEERKKKSQENVYKYVITVITIILTSAKNLVSFLHFVQTLLG